MNKLLPKALKERLDQNDSVLVIAVFSPNLFLLLLSVSWQRV